MNKHSHQLLSFKAYICCLVMFVGIAGQGKAAEPPENVKPPNRFRTADEVDENEVSDGLQELRNKDVERITIGQITHFHRLFFVRCIDGLPLDVKFGYVGPLATGSHRLGQRVHGPPAGVLEWQIHRGVVIFSVWISTVRTKDTLEVCKFDKTELFVNVSFVDEDRSVDEKLPELGDRSVREMLSGLTKSEEQP